MADEDKGTVYVILRDYREREEDPPLWREVGTARAGNDDAAINTFLETGDNGETYGEGEYRGVPRRSWAVEPRSKRKKIQFR